MQVLKYIEDSFESFNLRIKIELFILPIFILLILFVFLPNTNKTNNVIVKTNIVNEMKKLKMNEDIVNIIKNIESYANENFIKIKSISSDNINIKIELFADKKKQINFLKFIEEYNNFSKIKTLFIKQKILNVEISFQKIYLKKKIDLKNRVANLKYEKEVNLKLQAIIDKKALINNKWLKLNDVFFDYKLVEIDINSVTLENEFDTIKLKIYKHENI